MTRQPSTRDDVIWAGTTDVVWARTNRPAPARRRLGPGMHPDWCARGHRCNLGEHRADPVTFTNGTDVTVLTRVMSDDGRQHVEIRTRIALTDGDDDQARTDFARLLGHVDAFLTRLTRRPR